MKTTSFAGRAPWKANEALRRLLLDRDAPLAERLGITNQLLEGKVNDVALALARFAIVGGRPRDVVGTLDYLVNYVAQARDWRVARVHSARALDDASQAQLVQALSTLTGKNVELQIAEQPDLLGGVLVGDWRSTTPTPPPADVWDISTTPSRRATSLTPPSTESIKKRKYVMTELTISAGEITEALRKHVTDFDRPVSAEQVGRVVEVGDGIARVSGLPSAKVNELLEFEDGTVGLAMNLDEETIGAVVLGSVDGIEEEQVVRSTGRILSSRWVTRCSDAS